MSTMRLMRPVLAPAVRSELGARFDRGEIRAILDDSLADRCLGALERTTAAAAGASRGEARWHHGDAGAAATSEPT